MLLLFDLESHLESFDIAELIPQRDVDVGRDAWGSCGLPKDTIRVKGTIQNKDLPFPAIHAAFWVRFRTCEYILANTGLGSWLKRQSR